MRQLPTWTALEPQRRQSRVASPGPGRPHSGLAWARNLTALSGLAGLTLLTLVTVACGDSAAVGGFITEPPVEVSLVAGAGGTCLLSEDGRLSCWGTAASPFPAADGRRALLPLAVADNVDDVVLTIDATCLLSGGDVSCWSLERGHEDIDAKGWLEGDVRLLDGSMQDLCAAAGGDDVVCWPAKDVDRRYRVGLGWRPVALEVGFDHVCALSDNGEVACWDQPGQPTYDWLWPNTPGPVEGLPKMTQISSGVYHTCGVDESHRAWCWGWSWAGQLGTRPDTESERAAFEVVQVELPSAVRQVVAGAHFSCAELEVGGLYCWGLGLAAQRGVDRTLDWDDVAIGTPRRVLDGAVAAIAGGVGHICIARVSGQIQCWGMNQDGQLGVGTAGHDERATRVALDEIASIGVGTDHACAVAGEDRQVWCWGAGPGRGHETPTAVPSKVEGLTGVDSLSVNHAATCAVVDGQGWCWGLTVDGPVDGGYSDDATPPGSDDAEATANPISEQLEPARVDGWESVASISVGVLFACALHESGDVSCRGFSRPDKASPIGGETTFAPRQIAGLPAMTSVAAGDDHVCGVSTDGEMWCWGDGEQDGPGWYVPTLVDAGPVTAVDTHRATCSVVDGDLLCSNDTLFCLADEAVYDASLQALSGTDVDGLSVGHHHGCLLAGDLVSCWGFVGNARCATQVTVIDGADSVATGHGVTCVTTEAGEAYCWGNGVSGELGNGGAWSDEPLDVDFGD